MHGDELPQEVLIAIERVLQTQSNARAGHDVPLEGPDFNVAAVLNGYFPNEASLAHLQDVKQQLRESENVLLDEIRALRQELRDDRDAGRMQLIQEMISDLLDQISRIREKATESEAVVRDITKDIQVLDHAKKNLILSMTTLKRLQMLVNALSQLEDLVQEKNYVEIAQTLGAVKQLSTSFKPFISVRSIAQLWNRSQELQGELRNLIEADFDAFILQDSSKAVKQSSIADACRVIDILGPEILSPLVDRYVALELKEYRRIFRLADEAGQLDNLSRRFAWFRRTLSNHELEHGRVFPAEWRVGWHLLSKFTDITRDDLSSLLEKAGPGLTVKTLLDDLAMTAEFEASFAKKWATPFNELLAATAKTTTARPQSITSAFEPHMSVFIDAQDKAISDMLSPHRRPSTTRNTPRASMETSEGSREDPDEPIPVVMPSSTELFYFYGQTLEQCAKLSTAKPLFDLSNVHRKWLRIYAEDVIIASLKRPIFSSLPRKSTDSKFDADQIKKAALALNTADYCHATALQLEENIRSKIDPEFKEKVSFQIECDLFMNAVSTAIVTHLRELESAIDPAFINMTRTAWTTLKQVSGPSAYTNDIVKGAEMVIETLKPFIEQKKYLRNFFDKACSLILSKFTNALVKSRPLGEIGAEQLLIDLQTIKSWLSRMPGEALISNGYTKGLNKTSSRLDTMLKVIVTPVDPPEGFILNYTLLIGDSSFSNFQKVLDLKGTPKVEQNHLLDTFLTVTSTKDELESTSFLTSLDMDPPMTSQLAGSPFSPGASQVSLPFVGGDRALSPPPSGSGTGTSTPDIAARNTDGKREVFADFKRFVSFGLRRDSTAPS